MCSYLCEEAAEILVLGLMTKKVPAVSQETVQPMAHNFVSSREDFMCLLISFRGAELQCTAGFCTGNIYC